MEDFQLDLIIGEGPAARTVRIDLPPFTLVGATTRAGLLTTPLRDRFGIPLRLQFYTPEELLLIVRARRPAAGLRPDRRRARCEIARRSRGTPRVAGRLLRRVRDFAAVAEVGRRPGLADEALDRLEVDQLGLDAMDRRYLQPHRRASRRRPGRRRDPGRGAGREPRHARGRRSSPS